MVYAAAPRHGGTTPVYMFVGPTAHGLPGRLLNHADLRVLPPAERGTITGLIARTGHGPGSIVVVDGRFGDVMAVGHREILHALDAGWSVWGLGSLGAVRAAEMHGHGVRGFGEVFSHLRDTGAPDDEVAVLHGPEPEYLPLTEALVDLRSFLGHLADRDALSAVTAAMVLDELAALWFGDRTTSALIDLCRRVSGSDAAAAVTAALPDFRRHRMKTRDLATFLLEERWRLAC